MKQIKYQISVINTIEVNGKTEEQVILLTTKIPWSEANEEIAKKEAYNGYTIEDDGKPEPEPAPSGDSAVWDELDAAYQEGYREGVDSV